MATTNFGCGSSREHAPIAIKAAGVSAVVASSFARIFFRNAINIGLPLLESPEAVAGTDAGDILQIELETGVIKNITKGKTFKAKPYPEFMSEIIASGGLVEYTKKKISREYQMRFKIAQLAGDGIGPEMVARRSRVIKAVGQIFGHEFELEERTYRGHGH